mmetsp:Transcript_17425/g.44616  ORF Transcript_17425/g.44616 Transcript_17425/m.44616 type:complete len:148 (-) Transcript_17425:51-494(-)|eukprot:jgi/Tetstr1/465412/TSEL_010096.t1
MAVLTVSRGHLRPSITNATSSSRRAVGVPAAAAPDRRLAQRLGSTLLGLGLSAALLAGPAVAAEDCLKRCVKECNKIAPGSPEYCQETCADECSFQAAESSEVADAEGKQKVGNLGFLAEDYEGNSLDAALGGLFNWNRVGPNVPRR